MARFQKHYTRLTLLTVSNVFVAFTSFPVTVRKNFMIIYNVIHNDLILCTKAAWAFTWGFSFVKPFMRKYTLDKIFITGYDEKKWKPQLLDTLPIEAIPEKYGGTQTELNSAYDVIFE